MRDLLIATNSRKSTLYSPDILLSKGLMLQPFFTYATIACSGYTIYRRTLAKKALFHY